MTYQAFHSLCLAAGKAFGGAGPPSEPRKGSPRESGQSIGLFFFTDVLIAWYTAT